MAKIFLGFFNGLKDVNNPKALPLFYEGLIKGFRDCGNDVFAIVHSNWGANFTKDGIPKALLKEIQEFNPDLILLFNNSFYDLTKHFDCPIIVYEVDSPLYYRNIDSIKQNPSRYKFFVCQSSSADILISDFGVPKENVITLPFFTSIQAENVEHKHNISFIGSKFLDTRKHCLNSFMESNPSDSERKIFKNLIDKLEDNVFLSQNELLEGVESDKITSTFNAHQLVFLLSDYKRTKVLSNVADLGLDIWGTPNWANDIYNEPWLILNFHKELVYSIKHNQDIYNSSKIGINIGHLQAKNGFPWRVFDIMASNACLVTEYHGDFQKYMPNLKLPYYSNPYEAREICKKLLQDENWRLDLVSQSQEIVNKNFRFKNTLEIIENFLNMDLGSNSSSCGEVICKNLDEFLLFGKAASSKLVVNKSDVQKLGFKNKIRYKIWKHFDKMLKRKGIIK